MVAWSGGVRFFFITGHLNMIPDITGNFSTRAAVARVVRSIQTLHQSQM